MHHIQGFSESRNRNARWLLPSVDDLQLVPLHNPRVRLSGRCLFVENQLDLQGNWFGELSQGDRQTNAIPVTFTLPILLEALH